MAKHDTQITADEENEVFVFGSNYAGRHGKGAAKTALEKYGAVYAEGKGLHGKSYAIPTKGYNLHILPFNAIKRHVAIFLQFAKAHQELIFKLTQIGCGEAMFAPETIAPLFKDPPANVILPPEFKRVLGIQEEIDHVAIALAQEEFYTLRD